MKKTLNSNHYSLSLLFLLLFCNACSSKEETKITNKTRINFAMQVENQDLQLNTQRYQNANGDEYTIEKLAFYMSNIKFVNTQNGQFCKEPKSYHLIRLQNSNQFSFEIENLPNGVYDAIEFAIGVDSTQNTSLDNIGDLDAANGMAWDWTTGYKFLLLEGRFFPKNNTQTKGLVVHIGENSNYVTYKLPINQKFELATGKTTTLKLKANIAEVFKTPYSIDFTINNQIMGGDEAKKVSQNYADMITVVGVE
jgi:hypothetical protein